MRLVQESGERIIFSPDEHGEPVVILPLSIYEELVAGKRPVTPRPQQFVERPPRSQAPYPAHERSPEIDTYDGEGDAEYDAEQIFAQARTPKEDSAVSDRLRRSVGDAAHAYAQMQAFPRKDVPRPIRASESHPHDAGMRQTPPRIYEEERFSLGMGE